MIAYPVLADGGSLQLSVDQANISLTEGEGLATEYGYWNDVLNALRQEDSAHLPWGDVFAQFTSKVVGADGSFPTSYESSSQAPGGENQNVSVPSSLPLSSLEVPYLPEPHTIPIPSPTYTHYNHDLANQSNPERGPTLAATLPPSTSPEEPVSVPLLRTSPPRSNTSNSDRLISKRQKNTLAARKCRQKRLDRITELEQALQNMTRERDELRLELARKEVEARTLREMMEEKG
ncbi:MAG: hypothetical protein M1819_004237 [Sarea resinae]|nr:MAG: hypothetical protein M1819_004237 [Sarea resinae]